MITPFILGGIAYCAFIGTVLMFFGGVKRMNPDLQEGAAPTLPSSFDDFQFEHCSHIPLLREIHAWAWRNQRLDIQLLAIERLRELGAVRPRANLRLVYDADQREIDDEAAAQGVAVSELLRRG